MRLLHVTRPAAAAPARAGPSRSIGTQAARFALHVLQMCVVMCLSLALLGLLGAGAAAVFAFSDPRQSAPVLSALVVTLTLTCAMVAWMRSMAMGRQPTLEMASSAVLAGAVMITGYAVGIVPASELTSGVCGLACAIMIADMLFRFRLYASHTARPDMAKIEGEIAIGRPVEDVFDHVADQTNEPQYNPSMVRAEKVTPGPIGKGTRFRSAVGSKASQRRV